MGIEDATERRALERERDDTLRKLQALLREKDVLLEELEHRVGNSLQIIAAIILMKSRMVTSEETRLQLQDAHKRVMSVAAVQKHLHATGAAGTVEMAPYLTQLCDSLKTSMIGDYRPTTLKVTSDAGSHFRRCPQKATEPKPSISAIDFESASAPTPDVLWHRNDGSFGPGRDSCTATDRSLPLS